MRMTRMGERCGVRLLQAATGHTVPVDADRRVFDAELPLQLMLDLLADTPNIGIFRRLHLKRRQHTTGGQRPDMDMADFLKPRNGLEQMFGDLGASGVNRCAFEQDVQGVLEQAPCAAQDQQGHEDRQDGVDGGPARIPDHDSCNDRADRAEQVAHDVQDGALDVDVLGISARQIPKHEEIHEHADNGNDEHRASEDRLGFPEPFDSFIDDEADDAEQCKGVDQAGDYLEAGIAKGALAVGGAAAEAEGDIGEAERNCVGQHVAGIGKQRERARDHAADGLHDHESEDDEERNEDLALVVLRDCRDMRVVMIVAATVAMVVLGVVVTVMVAVGV